MKTLALDPFLQITRVPESIRFGTFHKSSPYCADNVAWRAFQDGMEALYRYAGRSVADSAHIAKANLRLLHHTLQADSSYRERLKFAEHNLTKNGLSTTCNLQSKQGLCADLITIPSGCDTHVTACNQLNRMYLVISGKVSVTRASVVPDKNKEPVQPKSCWNWIRHTSKENEYGKRDVILFTQEEDKEKKLTALEHRCLLLSISLSANHQASNQLSSDNNS